MQLFTATLFVLSILTLTRSSPVVPKLSNQSWISSFSMTPGSASFGSLVRFDDSVNVFRACDDDAGGELQLTSVVLDPPTPIIGQMLTIKASGNLAVDVTQGAKLEIHAKLGFIPVHDETMDLCQEAPKFGFNCPVAHGPQTLSAGLNVPNELPAETNVDVTIKATNADGQEILCLQGTIYAESS